MTKPSKYAAIIARLEAGETGRELDALIWAERDDRDVREHGGRLLAKSRSAPHDECVLGGFIDTGNLRRGFFAADQRPPIPHYTTSVAVVLTTLVLPNRTNGMRCRVILERKPTQDADFWLAEVRHHAEDGGEGQADTAAGALVIACLKAEAAAR